MKILKFSRIQLEDVPGRRALMTMKFLDDRGDLYSWAPKWDDLEQAFLRSLNVEGFNKPESEWLNRFASTVKEVAEGVGQPLQNARKVSGYLSEVSEGLLRLSTHVTLEEQALTPGFAVTYDFLGAWLQKDVEVLVVNNVAVHLYTTTGEWPHSYPDEAATVPT